MLPCPQFVKRNEVDGLCEDPSSATASPRSGTHSRIRMGDHWNSQVGWAVLRRGPIFSFTHTKTGDRIQNSH